MRDRADEYPCSNCDLKLETEGLLKAHLQTHNEQRSYECNECDKTFVRNDQLTRHIRMYHTKQEEIIKQYTYEDCSFSFETLSPFYDSFFHTWDLDKFGNIFLPEDTIHTITNMDLCEEI